MRHRLLTAALALAAGALLVALLLAGHGAPAVPRPTTEAQGGSGYRAAYRWLAAARVPVRSLRTPFDTLVQQPDLPASGNLLIVTVPAAAPFTAAERAALARWVEAGNTLAVLAALADTPDWAFASGTTAAADVGTLTGLTLEPVTGASPRAAGQPRTLVPARPGGWLDPVRAAVALSDHPATRWRALLPHEGFVLALAREQQSGAEVLWSGARGRGRILVAAYASLFCDRALGEADNARLLAALVGSSVEGGGAVLFDDLHQGLGDVYDPARFYRDPRLLQTLLILLAVWLAIVLWGAPLRAAAGARAPLGEVQLVRVTGRMLARVLPPRAAARALLAHFFQRVRRRTGQACADLPPWEMLERQPRIAPRDLARLRAWYEVAHGARRAPLARQAWLVRVHNLIQHIERQMGP
jgi:hypothetical protein